MRNAPAIDAARLSTLLNELRLPAIKIRFPYTFLLACYKRLVQV